MEEPVISSVLKKEGIWYPKTVTEICECTSELEAGNSMESETGGA
jgi:hypothetical protein